MVKCGPHAPDGRHARHARSGVRRLRRAGRGRDRAPRATRCRALVRAAARRHRGRAPGSTRRRASPRKVIARLAERTGLPLTEAKDHFAAQGARDALVETSGQLRALAVVARSRSPTTCAGWASGPRTGLAEIRLPDLQPGSSIMPGKVNPVIPEVVTQVGAQVIGNDAAVAFGGSQGNFELNVFVPVIAPQPARVDRPARERVRRVRRQVRRRASRPTSTGCKEYAESSPSIGTALNPYIGYETAAEIIKESTRTGKSIRADRPRPQADDRRRARPGARRRGDDPGRHHRMNGASRARLTAWTTARGARSSPRSSRTSASR